MADLRSSEPTEIDFDQKPWKHIGIRGYSKFVASDEDFMIFRRFETLNTRVNLALQDEICMLEDELNKMDTYYGDKTTTDTNNGTFRDDIEERAALIEKLEKKLYKYSMSKQKPSFEES